MKIELELYIESGGARGYGDETRLDGKHAEDKKQEAAKTK
jgi:hypothetical protein